MDKISFNKISVPLDQLASQGNAILGIKGSGKSYTGTYCAERLLDGGVPIVALDPIGIWRFLRVPAKEGGKAYPVVICGGEHGDLPLTVKSAEEVMRAAMKAGVSIVFDLYSVQLNKSDWRDIVTGVVKVLLYENKPFGLRHVFIEEAAEFVPQRIQPNQGVVYGMVERLVRMGGNAQLGVTLINQRAEELNKAVLDLCDLVILHRQKGRNSLQNLAKWMDVASVGTGDDVAKKVPLLANGQAFVWPAESDHPVQTMIPAKNTFHPDRRAMREAVKAEGARMDVGAFVTKMNAELAKQKTYPKVGPQITFDKAAPGGDRTAHAIAMLPEVYDQKLLAERRIGFADGYQAALSKFRPLVQAARVATGQLADELEKDAPPYSAPTWVGTSVVSHPIVKAAQRQANVDARDMVEGITKPDRAVLTVLAQHERAMEKEELGILSGYSPNTGHFNNTVGGLRSRGFVTEGWPVSITSAGIQALGPWAPLPKGADLREWWLERLGKPERLVLKAALEAYPEALTKGQLANRAGYQANTGHFTNTLGRLRTLRLLHGRHDIKASGVLFQ